MSRTQITELRTVSDKAGFVAKKQLDGLSSKLGNPATRKKIEDAAKKKTK